MYFDHIHPSTSSSQIHPLLCLFSICITYTLLDGWPFIEDGLLIRDHILKEN